MVRVGTFVVLCAATGVALVKCVPQPLASTHYTLQALHTGQPALALRRPRLPAWPLAKLAARCWRRGPAGDRSAFGSS